VARRVRRGQPPGGGVKAMQAPPGRQTFGLQ
jgi:hypothetical protein